MPFQIPIATPSRHSVRRSNNLESMRMRALVISISIPLRAPAPSPALAIAQLNSNTGDWCIRLIPIRATAGCYSGLLACRTSITTFLAFLPSPNDHRSRHQKARTKPPKTWQRLAEDDETQYSSDHEVARSIDDTDADCAASKRECACEQSPHYCVEDQIAAKEDLAFVSVIV